MGVYFNPDHSNFQKIINSDIYVDKTGLLAYTNRVINTMQGYVCVSRPRRFGKSIAANMLAAYYSRGCDSREMFSEFEIAKEKARSYTYLTVEQIEMYLSKFVFENTDDIKVRKLIVNAFIREVILYDDEIVITYTFTDNPEHLKKTKETTLKTENPIERAENSVSSYIVSSSIFSHFPPKQYNPNLLPIGHGFGFFLK